MTAALLVPAKSTSKAIKGSIADVLRQLTADMQDKIIRPAVYAGAELLTRELEARVPVKKGVLRNAIYTYHVDRKSSNGRHVYAVGINVKKAPQWFNVEFGHWRYNKSMGGKGWRKSKGKNKGRGASAHTLAGALEKPQWVPASPYLRPTADRIPDAMRAMQRELVRQLREWKAGNLQSYYGGFVPDKP